MYNIKLTTLVSRQRVSRNTLNQSLARYVLFHKQGSVQIPQDRSTLSRGENGATNGISNLVDLPSAGWQL